MNYSTTFHTAPEQPARNASIGSRMRHIRHNAQMTQEKLADALGVTVNYLGEIERGRKPLSLSLAHQFCQLFGVNYDYLYDGIPISGQHMIREETSYQSLHTAIDRQLSQCTHEELLFISHLITSFLHVSHYLKNKQSVQDHAGRQEHSDPKNGAGQST